MQWRDAVTGPADMTAIDTLIQSEKLPGSYRAVVDSYWRPLAAQIAGWRRKAQGPVVVGVNGGQGSGKTTLCRFLEEILLPEIGLRAVTLSLDDFYLSKLDRKKRSENIHPLFAIRGVPGTHDPTMAMEAIDRLKSGAGADIPKFDKARDDRATRHEWVRFDGPVDVILLEGWCVGAAPQSDSALSEPINVLEANEDQTGVWRRHVNAMLASDYGRLFACMDKLVMLRVPDMETVLANRREQERKLRESNPGAPHVMSDEEVSRFVQFYERLTRWMLAEMPGRADVVFDVADLRRAEIGEGGKST